MFGVIVFSNYVLTPAIIHVFMRDEKEEARSNKQGKATQHTQGSHDILHSRQSTLHNNYYV